MAFDLEKFNAQVYTVMTELVDQQIEVFNGATRGALTLAPSNSNMGDYAMEASFKAIQNLVRRRDVNNGQNAVTASRLTQLKNASVKVASGTPPIEFEPAQYAWVLQDPARAAATIGEQLAAAMLQDQVNTAIRGSVAAISGNTTLMHDITAAAVKTASHASLAATAAKFGDRSSSITAWVLHSKTMNDIWQEGLKNAQQLFNYGNVAVMQDPFGRVFVMTDSPALMIPTADSNPDKYFTLGLVPQAVLVEPNNDFNAVLVDKTGTENIQRVYQAEWSYNVGVSGYTWDVVNGGSSPNDTALGTSTNWDKTATSNKDTAGVLLKSE